MNRIASFALMLGTLLFSLSAVANKEKDVCREASREASKAAQDYRNAVGKMRTSCNSSYQECEQSRAQAYEALQQVNLANESMSAACVFAFPVLDDLLPFNAGTVLAAIDLVPESVVVPCSVVSGAGAEASIGCPGSWILNIPRTNVLVSGATATTFSFSGSVNVSATIPVRYEVFGIPAGSCNLTVGTSTGLPVTGTAQFDSSLPGDGGYFNRLGMVVTSAGTSSLNIDGCGILSDVASFVLPQVRTMIENYFLNAFQPPLLCGALGPELFGPCP